MTSQSVKKLSVSMNLKIFTSKIQLNQKTLKQRIRSQSSESKWFRLPIKIAKLDSIISHFNFSNKPSKHQIGLSCLITLFIRISK